MLTLGSLFDGSGGFPLAGAINGITPVWSSEIETYPLRVTAARFPNVPQLGSVLEINGWEIRPANIVTFGSPCQDLSVAGKQKGIHDGERSCLFFEAIRIAKEMRERDREAGRTGVDIRPRFLVWENVPGAFSSNGGEDFRAVLEAIGGIAEDGVSIPRTPKGKWSHAGCVVGEGWSIAWRLYDAQYWGVPQRRKRIYLIADLASERAGEILFERESLCGDPAEGGEAREGIAHDATGGAGGSGGAWTVSAKQQSLATTFETASTIGANDFKEPQVVCAGFVGRQGAKSGSVGYETNKAPTLRQGITSDVVYPSVARTLTAEHDASPCIDRGQNMLCYALQGNGIDRALTAGCNGSGWREQACYTLNTIDRHGVCYAPNGNHCGNYEEADVSATLQTRYHYGSGGDAAAVVYDCRENGDGLHVPTLTGDHGNRVTDYTAVSVHDMRAFGDYGNGETGSTLKARDYKDATDLIVGQSGRKYIVRRLTPLECCRLQGFPDWWEQGVEGSDSARYKMWGNGIALPCAVDVLRRIAKTIKEEST